MINKKWLDGYLVMNKNKFLDIIALFASGSER